MSKDKFITNSHWIQHNVLMHTNLLVNDLINFNKFIQNHLHNIPFIEGFPIIPRVHLNFHNILNIYLLDL
jgi:hypothetical protein